MNHSNIISYFGKPEDLYKYWRNPLYLHRINGYLHYLKHNPRPESEGLIDWKLQNTPIAAFITNNPHTIDCMISDAKTYINREV
jgi:hypothetical protein